MQQLWYMYISFTKTVVSIIEINRFYDILRIITNCDNILIIQILKISINISEK